MTDHLGWPQDRCLVAAVLAIVLVSLSSLLRASDAALELDISYVEVAFDRDLVPPQGFTVELWLDMARRQATHHGRTVRQ